MPLSLQRQLGLSRRRFLLAAATLAGGGLVFTWATRDTATLAESADALEPNAFLQLLPDGRVIFQLDKVEMGQGTMTGLVTLVAEELDLHPSRFEVRFAPVLAPFKRPMMLTGQSLSMADSWDVLRETGAAARAMLLSAAANEWQVAVAELSTNDGVILHPLSNRSAAYADFVAAAAQLQPPWRAPLKAPQDYRWIGTALPRLDADVKVRGTATYGIDVVQPDMLTAVVTRIPERGAVLDSYAAPVESGTAGVRGYVELAHGVAVVADDFWSAAQAAKAIELSWSPGPLAELDEARLGELETAQFERAEPDYMQHSGDTESRLRTAAQRVEAEYRLPYLAHAPMEPMNATVHVQPDRCDVWVPTQAPDMVLSLAADLTGLPRAQVHVHTTYLGGGFGRRVLLDFVSEALQIAREYSQPVKLIWTREDDTQHGYFRQRTAHRLRGGLNDAGQVQAWEHRQVATPTARVLMGPTMTTLLPQSMERDTRERVAAWMGEKSVQFMAAFQAREGAEHLPYSIPNTSFIQYAHDPGMPVSIWRSVGNSYNAFAVESFVDELAHASGADPAAFRQAMLTDARHLAVLNKLLEVAQWSAADGKNKGLALVESFGTVVGQVAEVERDENSPAGIRVRHVSCVVDCGRAINPDIVRAQMESGIIFGLTAALYGEITVAGGQVEQSNFNDYRMLTLRDAPSIEVALIASEREPTGVGEPGLPPVAPAVANAVFALTGERLRSLPLRLARPA